MVSPRVVRPVAFGSTGRPQRRLTLAGVAAVLLLPPSPGQAADQRDTAPRQLTLEDIVEMQSIDGITVSPDGKSVAYRLLTPSIERNRKLVQWFVVPADGSGPPAPYGPASEPLRMPMLDAVLDETPLWSADSKSLFVRLLEQGAVQIHEIGPGGKDRPVTQEAADIVSFKAGPMGETIVYTVRDTRSAIEAAATREEQEGVRIDGTVSLEGSRITRNFEMGGSRHTMRYFAPGAAELLRAGSLREASVALTDRRVVPDGGPAQNGNDVLKAGEARDIGRWLPIGKKRVAVSLRQTAALRPIVEAARVQVTARLPDGSVRTCKAMVCEGLSLALRQVWAIDGTGEAAFQFEKDYSGRSGLFAWDPLRDHVRQILAPEQTLDGDGTWGTRACSKRADMLYCVRSAPTAPPELVRIDLISGKITTLAAPNARLAALPHLPVRFIEWRDRDGNAANGFLVLPAGGAKNLPLVITSYRCRGYLRGSMSWLAAEQILAQRGLATLCINNNNIVGTDVEPSAAIFKAPLPSYEAIIDRLASDGLIDRTRVGLAGHSYTSIVGAYALSHNHLFAAAVFGTGITLDPATYLFTQAVKDSWRKGMLELFKMPNPLDDAEAWKSVSPALNAKQITAPLLLQPPENEYLLALQLFAAIKQAGGTADMVVFPNEGHSVSREPLHQLWRNRRAIDWFAYWLKGEKSASDEPAGQYAHWDDLRTERNAHFKSTD